LRLTAGWSLLLLGVPVFLLPIPLGLAMIVLGLVILSQESYGVRRSWRWARRRWPRALSPLARAERRLRGQRKRA
jgi:hypothetical protein